MWDILSLWDKSGLFKHVADAATSCSQWCKMSEFGEQQLLGLMEMGTAGSCVINKAVEVYGKFKAVNKADEGSGKTPWECDRL